MKLLRLALFCPLLAAMCWAQGTRTWEQTKYDEFEKGTSHGVAISSDGNADAGARVQRAVHFAFHLSLGASLPMRRAMFTPPRDRRRGSTS